MLLIEENTIYYRVSDRLYQATIADKEISPGRLVAQSDDIRDAHRAFTRRCNEDPDGSIESAI